MKCANHYNITRFEDLIWSFQFLDIHIFNATRVIYHHGGKNLIVIYIYIYFHNFVFIQPSIEKLPGTYSYART